MTTSCPDDENLYYDPACNFTLDDHVEMVGDLLPQGPAWPRDPDSGLMKYWRAFADVIKYAEDRICAFTSELFCDTADETLDIWYEQYGLTPVDIAAINTACIKAGFKPTDGLRAALCSTVAAQGGGSCAYLTAVAQTHGWVITCKDLAQTSVLPVAGCAVVGCTHLAERAKPNFTGSTVNSGPNGGNLFVACQAWDGTFDPIVGDAYTVEVTVDMNASMQLLRAKSPFTEMWTSAGCMTAGDTCNPLRGDALSDLKSLIDGIKPAHAYVKYVLA